MADGGKTRQKFPILDMMQKNETPEELRGLTEGAISEKRQPVLFKAMKPNEFKVKTKNNKVDKSAPSKPIIFDAPPAPNPLQPKIYDSAQKSEFHGKGFTQRNPKFRKTRESYQ